MKTIQYNPETHVLVPREPTEAMIKAAVMAHMSVSFSGVVEQQRAGMISMMSFTCVPEYKAMIAASESETTALDNEGDE